MSDLVLRVAAKGVIVREDGKVLVLREAGYDEGTNGGKWGLPGGRLNNGESYADGLQREIKEETGLEVIPGKPVYIGEWHPVIKGIPHQIIAIFTRCEYVSGTVRLSEEHDKFDWIDLASMEDILFMPPDDEVVRSVLE